MMVQPHKMDEQSAQETLDYLVRRFGPQVIKLAYYHLRDRYLAEDVAQEVFCRAYRNLDKFRNESSYYTWLYKITVNLCRDVKTSAYFRHILPLSSAEQKAQTQDYELRQGGEGFSAVMALPEKYRTVISLYYFDDMPTPEIARTLGLKEATVRTRLTRARELLREVFSEDKL